MKRCGRLDLGGSYVEVRVWGRESEFWCSQVVGERGIAIAENGKPPIGE